MLLLVLLLLLSNPQAYHFFGTTMTYYPKDTYADGSVSVVVRYKLHCGYPYSWVCSSSCGNLTENLPVTNVDESSGDWCQEEGITTYLLPNNSPLQLVLTSSYWVNNKNGIDYWIAVTDVELRKRSDTNKPNTSPQTTILPVVRLPSNCQRNINLLNFDPDGDDVKCRFGNDTLDCNPCRPPSVLSLSPFCTLSLSLTSNSSEGFYVVQVVMEDFPSQTITLTHANGSQVVRTPSSAISKIPIQFLLTVVPAVPSCTVGLYVPTFLPPTPKHKTQINAAVNQTVEILVVAEATNSTIMSIHFSGPYNVQKTTSGPGQYTLRWTPSDQEGGQSHPICFVVQANYTSIVLHSELRCVVVTVQETTHFTYFLKMKISTTMSLENKDVIEKLIKDELIKRGLPSHIDVHLRSNGSVKVTAAAP